MMFGNRLSTGCCISKSEKNWHSRELQLFLNVKCNNGGGVYDYVGIQFLAIFGKKLEYSSNCNFKGLKFKNLENVSENSSN